MVKRIYRKIADNKLIRNSVIFLVGSILIGAGNYIFHLLMGRMLTVEEFGEFEALIALMYIITVPSGAITLVTTKYTAEYKAESSEGKIRNLYKVLTQDFLYLGFILFLVFSLFSSFIADFLRIESIAPVLILGLIIILVFLNGIITGIITGLQKFKELCSLSTAAIFLKIVLAVIFVKLALSVSGVMLSIVVSSALGYLILLWAIKHIFKHEESEEIKLPSMFKYFLPTFFALLGLTLLYNIDLILVKKFFSPEIAGQYSAMAILGRVIYFASGAIVGVMFPMVAEAHRKNDNHRKILENALCFIFLGSLLTVLLYFIFPEFLIKILVGEKFLPIAGYVGWFAIAMSIFSLINALSQYFLSIKKMNFIYIILFGVVAQISLLFIFHSSLVQIIWVMNIAMGSIFLALLAFYFLSQRNDTQNT